MSSSSLRASRSATIRADKQSASVERKKKAEARKRELAAQPVPTETESSSSSSDEESDAADDYKHDDSEDIDAETSGGEDDEESESEITGDEELDDKQKVIDFSKKSKPAAKKRKREPDATPIKNGTSSATKKAKGKAKDEEYDEDAESDLTADEEEEDLGDGRKVVRTKLVKAPSGMAPPGQIDKNTMKFLHDLVKNNDREWFAKNGVWSPILRGVFKLTASIRRC